MLGLDVSGGFVELLGLFTSLDGAVVVLGDAEVLDEDELLELLFMSLDGGVVLLGGVEVLGDVELLGLFTSLCGIVPVLLPVPLQSDEIIFTLLTVRVFELEDDGFVLPLAVPVVLPLPEVVPVTSTMWPT